MEKEKSFAKSIQFIETSMGEGAHFKTPNDLSEDRWNKELDVTLTYILSPPKVSLAAVARIHNHRDRQWAHQIRDRTIKTLWDNSSTKTKLAYPFDELLLTKPKAFSYPSCFASRGSNTGTFTTDNSNEK